MIELYVKVVTDKVSQACQEVDISEACFWDWLGNTKFKEDNGNLTPGRASEIGEALRTLITEYRVDEEMG